MAIRQVRFHGNVASKYSHFLFSGLIIYRIWRVANNSAKLGASTDQIRFVMRVLIESGILYLSTTIAHFTVWWTPNNFAIGLVSKIASFRDSFQKCPPCLMLFCLEPSNRWHYLQSYIHTPRATSS